MQREMADEAKRAYKSAEEGMLYVGLPAKFVFLWMESERLRTYSNPVEMHRQGHAKWSEAILVLEDALDADIKHKSGWID